MKNINNFKVQKLKFYDGGSYFCSHKIHNFIMGDGYSIGDAIKNYKSAFQSVKMIEKKPIEYNKPKTLKSYAGTIDKVEADLMLKNIKIKPQKELVFNF